LKISDDIIEKIKDQNDIVDVISESVKLRRAGRNYSGLCPFHHEKTPSFSVSSEKQIYKCFGCGEAGNVITFIMKLKNLPFIDAVKHLAERANITLELGEGSNKQVEDRKERLYKINVDAARYFFNNLVRYKNAVAYFKARGMGENTIKRFGLGYAPDNWSALLKFLKGKGYSELDIISAGLAIKNEKGNIYDRFRNRVIFPVFDYRGKVIGFGGRVLDDSKPKYLNSPETYVFNKGTNLYGLNFAIKSNINRTFIVVEGYMDCISLHQHGITNAVASLGTALTANQAKLMKRYADKVIISYDADLAGQAATVRGLDILRGEGFDVRVLTVPSGKDPDEYIRSNGKEAFHRLIENALPLIEYKIKKAGEGIKFNDNEMVIQYIKKVTEILADLDPVEKDVYIKKISEETKISEQAIYDLLSGEIVKNVNRVQQVNTADNFGQKLYVEPAYLKAERALLKLMLENDENFQHITKNMNEEALVLSEHKKIYNLIIEGRAQAVPSIEKYIENKCDDIESSREWINIITLSIIQGEYDTEKLLNDYINEVKKYKLEETKKEIMTRIKECEAKGLLEESIQLAQELVKIQKLMEGVSHGGRR
jgi:DNA primase